MSDDHTTTMWLVQPVSPDLNHQALGERLGFAQVVGVLPKHLVDDPGRMVLVMGPALGDEAEIDRRLKDNKFVCGFKKESWVVVGTGYPFDQPDFAIYPLESDYVRNALAAGDASEAMTPGDGHVYKHSSQLPEWPPE